MIAQYYFCECKVKNNNNSIQNITCTYIFMYSIYIALSFVQGYIYLGSKRAFALDGKF